MKTTIQTKFKRENLTINENNCYRIECPILHEVNWEYNLERIFKTISFLSTYDFRNLKKEELLTKAIELKDEFTYRDDFRTHIKYYYKNEIDKLVNKLKYSKAIQLYEQYFNLKIDYANSVYQDYIKIVRLYNKLYPKKTITPKEITQTESAQFKLLKSKLKLVGYESNNLSKNEKENNLNSETIFKRTFNLSNYISNTNNNILKSISFEELKINQVDLKIKSVAIDEFNDFRLILDQQWKIHLFDKSNTQIKEIELNPIIGEISIYDRYSINISKTNNIIMVSINEVCHFFDLDFQYLFNWRFPQNKIHSGESSQSIAIDNAKNILEIHNNLTLETINEAYRKMAFRFHPDRNGDEDEYFNNRMKEINSAKEFLIKNIQDNKSSTGNYYGIIAPFNFDNMEFTSFSSNYISCTYFDPISNLVHFACNSGKIYTVNLDGKVENVIDFKKNNPYVNRLSSINKIGNKIFVYDGYFIHLIKKKNYVRQIQKIDYRGDSNSKLKWHDKGFLFYSSQYIAIYNSNCDLIDIIVFKSKIKTFSFKNGNLIIENGKRIYNFVIDNY